MTLLTAMLAVSVSAANLVPRHDEKGRFGYGPEGTKEFSIKPQWDEARPFNDAGMAIVRKDKKYGMINTQGVAIGKSMAYSSITPYDGTQYLLVAMGGSPEANTNNIKTRVGLQSFGFKGSTSYAIKGAKWGLVSQSGSEVIKPEWDEISNIQGDVIIIQKGGKYGLIDLRGNVLMKPTYIRISPFNNQGIAYATTNKGVQVLIDKTGKVLVDEKQKVTQFSLYKDDIYGNLEEITADSVLNNRDLWNDNVHLVPFHKLGAAWINSECPYVVANVLRKVGKKKDQPVVQIYNLDGTVALSGDKLYRYVGKPSEGVVLVVDYDDNRFFYDLASNTATPVEKLNYLPVRNGKSLGWKENDYVFVDKQGKAVSDHYNEVSEVNGCLAVRKGSLMGVLSPQGTEILPLAYAAVVSAGEGWFGLQDSNGKWGLADLKGNVTVAPAYDAMYYVTKGYAKVGNKRNDGNLNVGLIDTAGNEVVDLTQWNIALSDVGNSALSVYLQAADNMPYVKYDLSSKASTPTPFLDAEPTQLGLVVKNTDGLYGVVRGDKEFVACSLPSPEAAMTVAQVADQQGWEQADGRRAHRAWVLLHPKRHTYKLNETVEDDNWDY